MLASLSDQHTNLLAVAYGGGTNSTAMLCGFRERDIKPDLILFADTGAEMPHTYKHLAVMQDKVREWWGLELVVVRTLRAGKFEGLAGECLRGHKLPALAYGSKACSVKYKSQPQNAVLRRFIKERGNKTATRAIGFDANEAHRVKPAIEKWATNWFPLVEWGWRRADCVEAIKRNNLPQPGKSSCYFCPAMKRSEVLRLQSDNPDLLNVALAIERQAKCATPQTREVTIEQEDGSWRTETRMMPARGLGGEGNKWADWLAMDAAQAKLLLDIEPHEIPCGCVDG